MFVNINDKSMVIIIEISSHPLIRDLLIEGSTSNNPPSARNREKLLSTHENRDKNILSVIHKNKNTVL